MSSKKYLAVKLEEFKRFLTSGNRPSVGSEMVAVTLKVLLKILGMNHCFNLNVDERQIS